MSRATLDRLLAARLEFEAKIAAVLARIRGHAPDPEPPPDGPAPFSPAAGARQPVPPAEPLDAKGRAA